MEDADEAVGVLAQGRVVADIPGAELAVVGVGAGCSAPDKAPRLDAANVRRSFRGLCREAGPDAEEWTPRELRHSFVSLMSDAGVPLEEIARLVGHGSTKVTEIVYRKQLRSVPTGGAQVVDTLFELPAAEAEQS